MLINVIFPKGYSINNLNTMLKSFEGPPSNPENPKVWKCPHCNGTGKENTGKTCKPCNGTGKVKDKG